MADQSVDATASTSNKRKFTSEQLAVRNQRAKKWYADNKERRKSWAAQYYQENAPKIKQKSKQYRESHQESLAKYHKEYGQKNRNWIKAKNKNKYQRTKATRRKQALQKYRTDSAYRLHVSLRNRAYRALNGKFKTGSAVRDMGCTGQEACDYLESLFNEHMTWDNWGTYWQVDHIYPMNAANLEDRVEFLAVNNWRNLQPLEKVANIRKGDTVTPEAQKLFDDLKTQFLKEEV